MNHTKTIKTKCGIDKYHMHRQKPGIFHKANHYWFVFFATLVDLFKK